MIQASVDITLRSDQTGTEKVIQVNFENRQVIAADVEKLAIRAAQAALAGLQA